MRLPVEMAPRKRIVKVEEDEDLVVVKFQGLLYNENETREKLSNCKFHCLDTDQPIIQIGGQLYRGNYEDTPGTCACFVAPTEDSNSIELAGITEKCLVVNRVYLESKNKSSPEDPSQLETGDDSATGATNEQ